MGRRQDTHLLPSAQKPRSPRRPQGTGTPRSAETGLAGVGGSSLGHRKSQMLDVWVHAHGDVAHRQFAGALPSGRRAC